MLFRSTGHPEGTVPDSGRAGRSGFTVLTPPAGDALEGITRRALLGAMSVAGLATAERALTVQEAVSGRFTLMLTSTSTGVVPIHSLQNSDGGSYELPIHPVFESIRNAYIRHLAEYTRTG